MRKTELRSKVLGLLTQDPINLSRIYERTGETREAVLITIKRAQEAGLCVMAKEKRKPRGGERQSPYTARLTQEGVLWLLEPTTGRANVGGRPRGSAAAKMDAALPGSSWLVQSWQGAA